MNSELWNLNSEFWIQNSEYLKDQRPSIPCSDSSIHRSHKTMLAYASKVLNVDEPRLKSYSHYITYYIWYLSLSLSLYIYIYDPSLLSPYGGFYIIPDVLLIVTFQRKASSFYDRKGPIQSPPTKTEENLCEPPMGHAAQNYGEEENFTTPHTTSKQSDQRDIVLQSKVTSTRPLCT